ncbi:MAG TPA: C-type lectin domain-containing protein [Kofleriaceae bacterium]
MRVGPIHLAIVLLVACSFDPAAMTGAVDAPSSDAESSDAMGSDAETPPIDTPAVACPTDLPASCTGVLFECNGSPTCYALCTSPGANHSTAESRCVAWGGHLASLATTPEQACAVAIFTPRVSGDLWMGLLQSGGGGPTANWSYLDGTPYAGTGSWHTGQPDDYQGDENGEEQCGDMELGWTWEWNDDGCGDVQGYVCERPR